MIKQPRTFLTPPQNILPLQNTYPQQNIDHQEKFQWSSCNFILRQKYNNEFMYRSLEPVRQLVSTINNEVNKVKLKIEMDKPFEYDKEIGWNWHKSWIIPTIRVSLEFPFQTKNSKVLPETSSSKKFQKLFMIDVGVIGNNVVSAQNGTAVFQGLKFKQTSYKHDGSKFMLVMTLRTFEPGHVHPQIIQCVISSQFSVDSRKTDPTKREKDGFGITSNNQPFYKYNLQDFNPIRLGEVLVKRIKEVEDVVITNSAEGLFNYLTSPNIRKKIKNPFFLYLRFSSVLNMFYNRFHFHNEETMINTYIRKITKLYEEDKLKSKKERKIIEITENCLIIFELKASKQLREGISQKLDSGYGSLVFVAPESQLPPEFKHISKESIRIKYQEFYHQVNPYEWEKGKSKNQADTEASQMRSEVLLIRPLPLRPIVEHYQEEGHDEENSSEVVKFRMVDKMLVGKAKKVELITYCVDNQMCELGSKKGSEREREKDKEKEKEKEKDKSKEKEKQRRINSNKKRR